MCEADLVDEDDSTRALAADFDHDPERFAANKQATQRYSLIGDVHDRVADRLAKITVDAILDLCGGNGTLARSLNQRWRMAIVVDRADYVLPQRALIEGSPALNPYSPKPQFLPRR